MFFEYVVVISRKVRMLSFICKIYRRFDKIGKEFKLLLVYFFFKLDFKKVSNGEKYIIMMCRNNVV